jgi:DNA-binding transcriptional MerR regulator
VAEYRVDELARSAGTSVRNVRVYQDRGLLEPPRREGRIGWYSDEHLERLRLIGRLLERGYTFATIGELLDAWDAGGSLGDVLGLDDVIGGPWSQERPGQATMLQLRRRFGREATRETVRRAVALGLLDPDGTSFRVPSPLLLDAGADLVDAGVPLATVLDIAASLRDHMDDVAELFFTVLVATLVPAAAVATRQGERGDDGVPDDEGATQDLRRLAETVARLRPHALRAVEATFALAMQAHADAVLDSMTLRRRTTSAPDA